MRQLKDYIVKNRFIILYIIIFILLGLYFVPNQEKHYLKSDINKFKNDIYWKAILVFIIVVFIFLTTIFIRGKEKAKDNILVLGYVTLCILFFSLIFQNILISTALFANKFIDRNQTEIVYEVKLRQNRYSKIISESKNDTIKKISELDFFYRLEKIRLNNNLKSINKSDTIHIKYSIGLLGIKYVK
jgi:uncharacterized membrane protein